MASSSGRVSRNSSEKMSFSISSQVPSSFFWAWMRSSCFL